MNNNLNDIDKINMTYLLNRQYNIKNSNNTNNYIINKDIKFYKKRIIDLIKKIINNEIEENQENNDIKDIFFQFSNKCINKFKNEDINDHIQCGLKNVSNKKNMLNNENIVIKDTNLDDYLINKKENTLDNFVTKKTKNEIIIPKQNHINLYKKKNKVKNIKRNKMSSIYNENKEKE